MSFFLASCSAWRLTSSSCSASRSVRRFFRGTSLSRAAGTDAYPVAAKGGGGGGASVTGAGAGVAVAERGAGEGFGAGGGSVAAAAADARFADAGFVTPVAAAAARAPRRVFGAMLLFVRFVFAWLARVVQHLTPDTRRSNTNQVVLKTRTTLFWKHTWCLSVRGQVQRSPSVLGSTGECECCCLADAGPDARVCVCVDLELERSLVCENTRRMRRSSTTSSRLMATAAGSRAPSRIAAIE